MPLQEYSFSEIMFTNCLIVEDQTMFAEALAISLQATGLVGRHTIATTLGDARRNVSQETFDLVVADLLFPEGNSNEFLGDLTRLKCPPKIIVVTSLYDPWHLQSVLNVPVDAILTKGEPFQSLSERLNELMPPGPLRTVPVKEELARIGKQLSKREREVLYALGGGGTNQDIAGELGLSVRTVETHRRNISRKLKIYAGELVRAAVHFRDAGTLPEASRSDREHSSGR